MSGIICFDEVQIFPESEDIVKLPLYILGVREDVLLYSLKDQILSYYQNPLIFAYNIIDDEYKIKLSEEMSLIAIDEDHMMGFVKFKNNMDKEMFNLSRRQHNLENQDYAINMIVDKDGLNWIPDLFLIEIGENAMT